MPDQELIFRLKKDFKSVLTEILFKKMFQNDDEIYSAITIFKKYLNDFPEKLKNLSDLLIKWIFLNCFDSKNPSKISKFIDFLEVFLEKLGEIEFKIYPFEADLINGLCKNLLINFNENFLKKIISIQDKLIFIFRPEKISKFWAENLQNSVDRKLKRQVYSIFEQILVPFCKKDFHILSKPFLDPQYNKFLTKLLENYSKGTLIQGGFSLKVLIVEEEKINENFCEEDEMKNEVFEIIFIFVEFLFLF